MISAGWKRTKNGPAFGVVVLNYSTVSRGKLKKADSRRSQWRPVEDIVIYQSVLSRKFIEMVRPTEARRGDPMHLPK